jgi:hypothetical protein
MIKPQAVSMSDRGMIRVIKFWRRGKWSSVVSFKWREISEAVTQEDQTGDKATENCHERQGNDSGHKVLEEGEMEQYYQFQTERKGL